MYETIEDLPVIEHEDKQLKRGVDICLNVHCSRVGDYDKWKPTKRGLCQNCYVKLKTLIGRLNNENPSINIDVEHFVPKGMILKKNFLKKGRSGKSGRKMSPATAWFMEGVDLPAKDEKENVEEPVDIDKYKGVMDV